MSAIRSFTPADWPDVWALLEPVFRAGETYGFPTDIDAADAHARWVDAPLATHVVLDSTNRIAGTYYLKANHGGPGAHVCNCGYVVAETARGQGLASAMCEHSQALAVQLGFRAMQYNLVAATNTGALRLWRRHGFGVVGTLPGAFHHPRDGFVDAHIMYKTLM